jgi:hypothetical protein
MSTRYPPRASGTPGSGADAARRRDRADGSVRKPREAAAADPALCNRLAKPLSDFGQRIALVLGHQAPRHHGIDAAQNDLNTTEAHLRRLRDPGQGGRQPENLTPAVQLTIGQK